MRAVAGAVMLLALGTVGALSAQDNYEIQVYPSGTVEPGVTMLELHSNYTPEGLTSSGDGTLASNHALHETIEVTHGFTPWFEIGAYLFTSLQGGRGLAWVGDHIRPRVRVPEGWHWPVGVSLSTEVGYARQPYAADEWSWEIRPIIDKQWGRFYWSLNPALEIALSGPDKGQGAVFAPNIKVSVDLTRVITFGLEYYGSLGPLSGFDPGPAQVHAIYPAVDLNLGADWEFNAGVGIGLTDATDKTVLKVILGRRFGGRSRKPSAFSHKQGDTS